MNRVAANYEVITEPDRSKWLDFLEREPNGNIFQTPYMFDVYNNTDNQKPLLLAVINKQKEEVIGMLLAVIQLEGKGFLDYFTARSVIVGGPLIKDSNPKTLELILQHYDEAIDKHVIYSQIRNAWQLNDAMSNIFIKRGYTFEPHLNLIHDLRVSVDEQWMRLHKGRRKNIRRAQREGLIFKEAKNRDEFEKAYKIVKSTYKRIKMPMPTKSFFYNSYSLLTPKSSLKVFLAILKKEIIAARMVLCHKDKLYDWYAGASNEHLDKYPNDYLPWKIMEWGTINGYKTFDFGGAGKPNIPYGVRDYKLKFGGEIVNWGRFEKINKPVLMNLGRLGLQVYRKVF